MPVFPPKVWHAVDCVATASLLSLCELQSKPLRPWQLDVRLPEAYLLFKPHLQGGVVGSSLQGLPTVEPIYLGEPPPGQEGLQ